MSLSVNQVNISMQLIIKIFLSCVYLRIFNACMTVVYILNKYEDFFLRKLIAIDQTATSYLQ